MTQLVVVEKREKEATEDGTSEEAAGLIGSPSLSPEGTKNIQTTAGIEGEKVKRMKEEELQVRPLTKALKHFQKARGEDLI